MAIGERLVGGLTALRWHSTVSWMGKLFLARVIPHVIIP